MTVLCCAVRCYLRYTAHTNPLLYDTDYSRPGSSAVATLPGTLSRIDRRTVLPSSIRVLTYHTRRKRERKTERLGISSHLLSPLSLIAPTFVRQNSTAAAQVSSSALPCFPSPTTSPPQPARPTGAQSNKIQPSTFSRLRLPAPSSTAEAASSSEIDVSAFASAAISVSSLSWTRASVCFSSFFFAFSPAWGEGV